ncbi:myelin basic protein isoform X2 [Ambystoma mexicanum]|uniref:myelin basic protein isoform X2 n=1 Tax=Ambystoma mexicanum TaxID=8296 RepID=UPI0037E905CF
MGNHVGKRDQVTENAAKNVEPADVEETKTLETPKMAEQAPQESMDDNEVFGEADVNQNNGTSSKSTAVTDSTGAAEPEKAWTGANPADSAVRPHLVRLFSRDAPGREDNTFKDRPSESDELQTIQEDSSASSEESDTMASQKHSTRGQGSKMATASTSHHSRYSYDAHGRHRDSGLLDSLGKFFGGEKQGVRKGSGKDYHASRASHVTYSPQKASHQPHGRHVEDNPVVHFFKNIVSPRTPPPMQQRGAEGQKPSHGSFGSRGSDHHKSSSLKGYKDTHREGQGTLSKIFKLGGKDSRSGSPVARR